MLIAFYWSQKQLRNAKVRVRSEAEAKNKEGNGWRLVIVDNVPVRKKGKKLNE